MKKFLTTLLCLIMVFTMIPMATGVAFANGYTDKTVSDILPNDFPDTAETAWKDDDGNSIYCSGGKWYIQFVGEEPIERIPKNETLWYDSWDFYSAPLVGESDDKLRLYFSEGESGWMYQIDYVYYVQGEDGPRVNAFYPPITVEDVLALSEDSFPTTLGTGWMDSYGNTVHATNGNLLIQKSGEQEPAESIALDSLIKYDYWNSGYSISLQDNKKVTLKLTDDTMACIEYYDLEYYYYFYPTKPLNEVLASTTEFFPTTKEKGIQGKYWDPYYLYLDEGILKIYDAYYGTVTYISVIDDKMVPYNSAYHEVIYTENGMQIKFVFDNEDEIVTEIEIENLSNWNTYEFYGPTPLGPVNKILPEDYRSFKWMNENGMVLYVSNHDGNPSFELFVFDYADYREPVSEFLHKMTLENNVSKATGEYSGQEVTFQFILTDNVATRITVSGYEDEYVSYNGTYKPVWFLGDFLPWTFPYAGYGAEVPLGAWFNSDNSAMYNGEGYLHLKNSDGSMDIYSEDYIDGFVLEKNGNKYQGTSTIYDYNLGSETDKNMTITLNISDAGKLESITAEFEGDYSALNGTYVAPKTIEDILPEDFPTTADGEPTNKWKNSNGVTLYLLSHDGVHHLMFESDTFCVVPPENPIEYSVVSKTSTNSFEFTSEVLIDLEEGPVGTATFTFNVNESGKTESIDVTFEGDSNYYILNGVYKAPTPKPTPGPTPSYTGGNTHVETTAERHDRIVEIAETQLAKTVIKAKSKLTKLNGKKAVKINWSVTKGDYALLDFDGFDIFRSTEKSSGYGKTPFFSTTKTSYTNNKELKKGKTYYYKVRAYKIVDGEKVYTGWSTKAWRTVK